MTNSERLFLRLAEELNFSRAAEKAYISQQCLSDHIRRMEESYGTKLFLRKPNVELTEAGKAVRQALLEVSRIEQGLESRLDELENGVTGTLRFALNCARAKVLLPPLFTRYHQIYPHVQLELVVDETVVMQEMMRKGKLDCFLGVNGEYDSTMQSVLLSTESFYLVASESYLRMYTRLEPEHLVNKTSPADLRLFRGLPFILNHAASTAHPLLQQFMSGRDISVENILCTSEYDLMEQIGRNGQAAFFCPQLLVPSMVARNRFYPAAQQLFTLPIQGLSNTIQFCLVYDSVRYYPRYAVTFFEMVQDIVKQCLT